MPKYQSKQDEFKPQLINLMQKAPCSVYITTLGFMVTLQNSVEDLNKSKKVSISWRKRGLKGLTKMTNVCVDSNGKTRGTAISTKP